MKEIDKFLLPINLDYDRGLLYQFAESYSNNDKLWRRFLNHRTPGNYWLEIRGGQIGNHSIVRCCLKLIRKCIDSNAVALHKIPPKMSMPKHIDISTSGDKNLRKSVLIIPITEPCPGTRFYLEGGDVFTKPFESPTLIRVTNYHDVYNDLDKPRITLQVSFKKTFDEMRFCFHKRYHLC